MEKSLEKSMKRRKKKVFPNETSFLPSMIRLSFFPSDMISHFPKSISLKVLLCSTNRCHVMIRLSVPHYGCNRDMTFFHGRRKFSPPIFFILVALDVFHLVSPWELFRVSKRSMLEKRKRRKKSKANWK